MMVIIIIIKEEKNKKKACLDNRKPAVRTLLPSISFLRKHEGTSLETLLINMQYLYN